MSTNAPKFTAFAFNAAAVAPAAAPGDTLPAGWYQGIISDAEVKAAKGPGNNTYVQLTHRVTEGPYAGREIVDRQNNVNSNAKAQQIGLGMLSALCHSVGVIAVQDLSQLLNRPLQFKLKEVPAEGKYDAKNEVSGYKPADGAAPMGAPPFQGPPAGLPPGPPPAGAPAPAAPFTPPPAPPAAAQAWGGAPGAPAAPPAQFPPNPGQAQFPPQAAAPFAPPAQPVPAPAPAPAPFQAPPPAAPAPLQLPPGYSTNPQYPGWVFDPSGQAISEADLAARMGPPPAPQPPAFQPPAAPAGFQPPAPGSPSPWGAPPQA